MSTRQELFSGEFDGLVVASDYDPFEIVEMLSPYLAGSASIVVQNMFLQVFFLLLALTSSLITPIATSRLASKDATHP